MDVAFLVNWASSSLRLSSPLALTAIGGVFSERSGVFNIGMEGMMLCGAFFGILGSDLAGNPYVGALLGSLAGMVLGLALAVSVVTFRADQIVVGIAINLFALGLTNLLFRDIFGGQSLERVSRFGKIEIPLLSEIPGIGEILFSQAILVYLAVILPFAAAWFLTRTRWGLGIRAIGDHPQAADTVGLPVIRTRFACLAFSGFMAGLGGAALALQGAGFFAQNMTAGRGFVVLAAIVVGRWNPIAVVGACLLFGAADALQINVQTLGISVPSEFFVILPYVLTVIVLAGVVGRGRAPRALGQPYVPGRG